MHRALRTWIVLAAALCPAGAWAQARVTGADLEGTVRDESGSVVPGASVIAANLETTVERITAADSEGRYVLPALPPGVYRVTAELFGFGSHTRENVSLLLGQAARLDFSIHLAGRGETIAVAEAAPVQETGRTAVAHVVDRGKIESLPINGRNVIGFAALTPGVATDRVAPGVLGTSGLSFAGQTGRANNIMVDGFDNNDVTIGAARGLFSQEAVREFQVLTGAYSAEFGQASGGVVNVVTRSGANELHGEAFAFFRDDALNARSHFEQFDVFGERVARAKAPFRQWQWGGTLSGPLVKGRTFFFLSFERAKTRASNFVNIDPEAAAALAANGFPVELGQVPYDVEANLGLLKLNHQWSPRSSLVLRGSLTDTLDENGEPFGGTVARSRAVAMDRTDWFVSAAQTDVLSSRWVNEARAQFLRFDQLARSLDPGCDGLCDGPDEGGPAVMLMGVASVGRAFGSPHPRLENRLQVGDTVTFFGGRHLVKAGIDFQYLDTISTAMPSHFGGSYVFAPLPGAVLAALGLPPRAAPLSPVEALWLGLPAAYIQGYGQPNISLRYKELAAFVQDDWRLGQRLTLKAGLRYQRQFWPQREYDIPHVGGGRLQYGTAADTNDFAPRLALAFDPRGDGRTSLHAGYGLFYGDHIGAIQLPHILDGGEHVRVFTRFFPESVGAWWAPGRTVPEPAGGVPLVLALDPGLKTPFVHQFTAGIDQAIGRNLAVSVNYIRLRGHNHIGTLDYNPLVPALGPGRRPNDAGGVPGSSASLLQFTSFGRSWYDGLAVSVSKRFSAGNEFLLSYTLSRAEDTVDDFDLSMVDPLTQDFGRGRNPADPHGLPLGFDPLAERAPSLTDQRHRAVLSGTYQLPWALRVSAVVTAGSGRPYNLLAGADLDGNGHSFDRPRRDPSDPATSVGRNSGLTEGTFTLDLRLSRRFRLGSRTSVEAIGEVFNLTNATNFTDPNPVFGAGAFPGQPLTDQAGRVTYGLDQKALAPRQIQLAMKLSF